MVEFKRPWVVHFWHVGCLKVVGVTNYVDGDKHLFSFGLSLEIKGLDPVLEKPLEFHLAAQLIWLPERLTQKENPADPIGSYRASGLVFGGSCSGGTS